MFPVDSPSQRIGRAAEAIAVEVLGRAFHVTPIDQKVDVGYDLIVRTMQGDQLGQHLALVQVKGRKNLEPEGSWRLTLRLSTLNLLNAHPRIPGVLLLVDVTARLVFWAPLNPLSLHEVRPVQGGDAVSFRVSRENLLDASAPGSFHALAEYIATYDSLWLGAITSLSPETAPLLAALGTHDHPALARSFNRQILAALNELQRGEVRAAFPRLRDAAERNLGVAAFTEIEELMRRAPRDLICVDREIATRSPDVWEQDPLLRVILETGSRYGGRKPVSERHWTRIFVVEDPRRILFDDTRLKWIERALVLNHHAGFRTILALPRALPAALDANLSDGWLVPGEVLCVNPPPTHLLAIFVKERVEDRPILDFYTAALTDVVEQAERRSSSSVLIDDPEAPGAVRDALTVLAEPARDATAAPPPASAS